MKESEGSSRLPADSLPKLHELKFLKQWHVYGSACVCVYLGTAVRVASGARLKLTDPKLLLLSVCSYNPTDTEELKQFILNTGDIKDHTLVFMGVHTRVNKQQ